MAKISGAFPVRWKPQDGAPGANAKSIYINSFDKPAKPTGSAPSGWYNDIPEQTSVSVEHQGDWIKDADGWHVAPQIGNSQDLSAIIQFITTEENQVVYLRVKASIPTMDDVFVGKVDAASPRNESNNRYFRLYGLGQDTGDYAITVPTAGVHFLIISYVRLSDTTSTMAHYVKYKFGVMPTWKSDALTFSADGSVSTWSSPYKVSTDAVEEAAQTRPNLLLQTSFISSRMDKWVVKGGATTSGLDGHSAYVGTNNDTGNYKELLKQIVYDPANTAPQDCKVRPSTWYTLSFWAKAGSVGTSEQLATYLYPNATQSTHTYIDTSAGRYVDGKKVSATNSTDNCTLWKLTTEWTRHWMAFRTASHLSDTATQQLLFRLLTGAGTVYICMPKLERGIGPTAYCTSEDDLADRAADESGFPNDRGLWVENFADTKQGLCRWNDTRRDYVAYPIGDEYKFFFVRSKGQTVPDGHNPAAGGTTYWEEGSTVKTLLSNTIIGKNVNMGGFLVSDDVFTSSNGRIIIDGKNNTVKILNEGKTKELIVLDGDTGQLTALLAHIEGYINATSGKMESITAKRLTITEGSSFSGKSFSVNDDGGSLGSALKWTGKALMKYAAPITPFKTLETNKSSITLDEGSYFFIAGTSSRTVNIPTSSDIRTFFGYNNGVVETELDLIKNANVSITITTGSGSSSRNQGIWYDAGYGYEQRDSITFPGTKVRMKLRFEYFIYNGSAWNGWRASYNEMI